MENINKTRYKMLLPIIFTLMMTVTLLSGCQTPSNDGKIISKELLKALSQNSNINIYKIFYYSDGTKVEALLTKPKAPGKYPLLVNLHGGFSLENMSRSHYDFGYKLDTIKYQTDQVIELFPEFRGYLESDGYVHGIEGNTLDTENAIKAVISMGNVKTNSLYLLGYSMGGGVALRTASERHDVKAVAAVSPFVGWDEYIHWMEQHPNSNSEAMNYSRSDSIYVKNLIKKHPDMKSKFSLLNRISDIQAPVLFLQGTADTHVAWQTVQEFSDDMKKANKTVKLILYSNGKHGLNDQYQDQSYEEIQKWFKKNGLHGVFNL